MTYAKFLQWLGGQICNLGKRHEWGKPYKRKVDGNMNTFDKRCKRCGEVREVKRRVRK